ncbi:MAG: sugar ABC transporter substrate-binding protein [bacterium]|nr:sugar ABC transporter substrate-binding protein [bacterium]
MRSPSCLLCLLVCAVATIVPVRSAYGGAEKVHEIGVLYWSMNIPGQVAMRKGLEQEARRINKAAPEADAPEVRLIPYVAGDDVKGMERQIAQMRELIKRNVDLIIVQPTDNAALAKPLKEANKAGIPVVAYDQYISGGALACYLTSDNYQAGYLNGEYVAAAFPDDRKLRVILVEYPHVSSTVERVNGFLDALGAYKQPYAIVGTYSAVEPESGRRAGVRILKDFSEKGSVDVVFTVNDGGGLAVVKALTDAGRDELFVATIDGDPDSVAIIREGGITRIDSAQFCGALGAETLKAAYRLLNGEKVPRHILLPTFPITRETVDQYGGWLQPMPKRLKKPWHSAEPYWEGKLRVVGKEEQ